jgi:hypothetical protein
MVKKIIKGVLRRFGFDIVRYRPHDRPETLRDLPNDDYGHWQGARRAVDEYLAEHQLNLYLHRVDYTCRVAVRTP